MYFPYITDGTSAVQMLLLISCTLIGLSHILQPKMWFDYFADLKTRGHSALITRSFTFELWPALLIVALHQVWSGPAIIITIYGHLLLLKFTIAMLAPKIGMKSLDIAKKGDSSFIIAGGLILVIAGSAAWVLFV